MFITVLLNRQIFLKHKHFFLNNILFNRLLFVESLLVFNIILMGLILNWLLNARLHFYSNFINYLLADFIYVAHFVICD
jgi:hypothetical protein